MSRAGVLQEKHLRELIFPSIGLRIINGDTI